MGLHQNKWRMRGRGLSRPPKEIPTIVYATSRQHSKPDVSKPDDYLYSRLENEGTIPSR
jgi:hypothetical protein